MDIAEIQGQKLISCIDKFITFAKLFTKLVSTGEEVID